NTEKTQCNTKYDHFKNKEVLERLKHNKIAILPLIAEKNQVGWQYAEELTLFIGKLQTYEIVERLQVQKLFQEQDFDPNRIDEAEAVVIGKMLGAKGVIIGSIGEDFINVRMLETETGKLGWNSRFAGRCTTSRVWPFTRYSALVFNN
ncbi:MAG: hypothetical protein GY849_17750, partial [Deltaproteobacteria bacterium]|nr:hypothetical protein [Deltaproteobacteria bacterium]